MCDNRLSQFEVVCCFLAAFPVPAEPFLAS